MINKFGILNATKCFCSEIFQNFLVFIPAKNYIKYFIGTSQINSWKSNELSEENIGNIAKWDSAFAPSFVDYYALPDIIFNWCCLMKMIPLPLTK